MTEQEKRELDEFIAVNYMGWEFKMSEYEWEYYKNRRFTDDNAQDLIALMEQKIQEKGLVNEYIDALIAECDGYIQDKYSFEESIWVCKTAIPLQCCIAARKAWEVK